MQVFAAQSGIASAMHGRWVEGWFGGGWGVVGGPCFLNGKSSAAIGTLPKKGFTRQRDR